MSLLVLVIAATLLGSAWGHWTCGPRASWPFRALVFFLTGLLEIHLLLRVMSAAGLPWSLGLVVPALLIIYLVTRRFGRGKPVDPATPGSARVGLGWSDALAAIPWLSFSFLCWQQKIVMPAFIREWGLEGQRLFLSGGHLQLAPVPGNAPSAPGLLPDLYALTAELGGGFHQPEILLWSPVFFLGILIAARETLSRDGVSPRRGANATLGDGHHLALAILGFSLAAFGIGYPLAGSPDWLTALVLVTAVPALAEERPDRHRDLQIGVLAALACATDRAGLWLAGLLIAAYGARRVFYRRRRPPSPETTSRRGTSDRGFGLRIALPAIVVVASWFLAMPFSELRQLIQIGVPDVGRLPAALAEAAGSHSFAASSGLILGILPLPLLYLTRDFRLLAAVVTAFGAGLLWAILAAPVDTMALAASSLPLFAFHVVPAVLAAVGVVVERWRLPAVAAGRSTPEEVFDSATARHPIDEEWGELASHWDLVLLWTQRNIKLRYKRSLLGVMWSLLEPFAIITTLVIVFSSVFRFEVPSYPVYILSGWILWDFFSKATTAMTDEADDGWRLSSRVRAPRSAFLVAALFTHLFNWTLALLLTTGALVVLGHPISAALLSLPLVMAVTAVFAFGIGLSVSTLSVFFSDFGLLYRVLLTIWLYATPVIYPLEIIPEKIRPLFLLNPLTHILSLVRAPIYAGHVPPLSSWLIAVMLSLGAFAVGWWVFAASRDALGYRA